MNNMYICFFIIFLFLIVLLVNKTCPVEGYHNHQYSYSPGMDKQSYCSSVNYNNPIPSGYEGWKCLRNQDCYPGLKCCYEKQGFDLVSTSGVCRPPSECNEQCLPTPYPSECLQLPNCNIIKDLWKTCPRRY